LADRIFIRRHERLLLVGDECKQARCVRPTGNQDAATGTSSQTFTVAVQRQTTGLVRLAVASRAVFAEDRFDVIIKRDLGFLFLSESL